MSPHTSRSLSTVVDLCMEMEGKWCFGMWSMSWVDFNHFMENWWGINTVNGKFEWKHPSHHTNTNESISYLYKYNQSYPSFHPTIAILQSFVLFSGWHTYIASICEKIFLHSTIDIFPFTERRKKLCCLFFFFLLFSLLFFAFSQRQYFVERKKQKKKWKRMGEKAHWKKIIEWAIAFNLMLFFMW